MAGAEYQLIVAIVRKGRADEIADAAKQGGASGSTILYGRGTGIHGPEAFLGVRLAAEQEIVLVLVPVTLAGSVFQAIIAAGRLEQPGTGLAFRLDLAEVAGIIHSGPPPA